MYNLQEVDMILFLDIETAPEFEFFKDVPEDRKYWFRKRFKKEMVAAAEAAKNRVTESFANLPAIDSLTMQINAAIETAEQQLYVDNVSFFAESARIVCVSVGSISTKDKKLSIKSIVEQDENKILFQLTKVMDFMVGEDSRSARPKYNFLCGHNAMEFDFPFLMRRYMKWKMKLPRLLDNYGKKPWEMPLLDTALIWKGSSYKYYAQLAMICDCLGVESPKGEMDGSMVAEYFRAGKWKEIAFYCNDDVIALVNCFMRMNGGEQFDTPDIIIK
jgi:hypothetical protein